MKRQKAIVIGGGPAGMMVAGTAASRGLDVTLIEKNDRLGKKLLITGNGRCNITNAADIEDLIANVPVNGKFLYSAFYTFSNMDLLHLLHELGLKTKVEAKGRVFPISDQAVDVVLALQKYMQKHGVKIVKGEVEKVISENKRVAKVVLTDKRELLCDKVIVATGGLSYPGTGSTGDGYRFARENGHKVTSLKPSLVPLVSSNPWVSKLQGVSLKGIQVTVMDQQNKKVYEECGEMLFTHFGVSGPVILSASSHIRNMGKQKYKLLIDLQPDIEEEDLDKKIQDVFMKQSNKILSNVLTEFLPKKMIPIVAERSKILLEKPVHQISKLERNNLVKLIKNFTVDISGLRSIKDAIITSGGVDVREIDPSTMESKLITGLYFAGEVIDVDAYTGGFNLQIAFSTGYLAGASC